MRLNRRNFILSLVGGIAGIQVTPLPWKLMDDSAIWTQNWPWVPVPATGEFSSVKSVCSLCSGGCGIEVRKVDNRAVKIEGRTDFPVNPGGICPVGMGGLQLLYDESIRYLGPMKRVGPRGAGVFENISWKEALDILSRRISSLRKKGIPEALAIVDGNRNDSTMSALVKRFATAAGTPNYITIPSMEDTYRTACDLMMGKAVPMSVDLENADYILSFGCGLLEGWGAPGRVLNAWGLWKERGKVKIVQIESRASNTASKADEWLAPVPGTEAALALGIANVIINQGLFDASFINRNAYGFEDWTSEDGTRHMGFKRLVTDKYSPKQVSEITGLKESRIVAIAKEFASAGAPVAICGKGKGNNNGSLYEFMAVQALNALVGNINRPGGVFVNNTLPLSDMPDMNLDSVAARGLKTPRMDKAGGKLFPFTGSLINNMARAINEGDGNAVDTLLVFASNPAFTLPDGGAFKRALSRIPFIVSFSPYRDETSYMADLVLPDHVYLEKRDEIVSPPGLQYPLYALSQPVVEPLYNTRHTGDVIIQMAKRSGLQRHFPWSGYEDVLKFRARGLFDSGRGLMTYKGNNPVWKQIKQNKSAASDYVTFDQMWKGLLSGKAWYRPPHTGKLSFATKSGKFEFVSSKMRSVLRTYSKGSLKAMGIRAKGDEVFMPHYERPESSANHRDYPLRLVPYEIINLADGFIPSPPFLTKTLFDNQLRKNESFIEINPKTASACNLKEGDRIFVESPAGRVEVRVCLTEEAMPGNLYMPLGFGHTAYDEFIRGKGVTPNQIISAERDPLSGQFAWWNTPVKIVRI